MGFHALLLSSAIHDHHGGKLIQLGLKPRKREEAIAIMARCREEKGAFSGYATA